MLTVEEELRLVRMQLETMIRDRDAEKSMKATARMQRDKMTKRYKDLVGVLESAGILQYDEEWAVEIQQFIKDNK